MLSASFLLPGQLFHTVETLNIVTKVKILSSHKLIRVRSGRFRPFDPAVISPSRALCWNRFFSGVIGVVPGLAKSAVPPRGTPANKKGTSEVDARRFRGAEPLSKQRSPPCILGICF